MVCWFLYDRKCWSTKYKFFQPPQFWRGWLITHAYMAWPPLTSRGRSQDPRGRGQGQDPRGRDQVFWSRGRGQASSLNITALMTFISILNSTSALVLSPTNYTILLLLILLILVDTALTTSTYLLFLKLGLKSKTFWVYRIYRNHYLTKRKNLLEVALQQTLLHMILFLIFSLTFKLSSQQLQQHHMNFSSQAISTYILTIILIYTHNSSSLFSTMLISLNMSTFRLVTHLILSSLRKTQLYHPQLLIHLFHHLIIFLFSHLLSSHH